MKAVQAFLAVHFLTARSLALTQERKDRKERRKDMFIGLPGQQKKFFVGVIRDLVGSRFFFHRPFACAHSRAQRPQRKTQRHVYWPSGPTKTCLSSRPSRSSRFNRFKS
jgi:hypothetical protein